MLLTRASYRTGEKALPNKAEVSPQSSAMTQSVMAPPLVSVRSGKNRWRSVWSPFLTERCCEGVVGRQGECHSPDGRARGWTSSVGASSEYWTWSYWETREDGGASV